MGVLPDTDVGATRQQRSGLIGAESGVGVNADRRGGKAGAVEPGASARLY
jgi:hypothetical protein